MPSIAPSDFGRLYGECILFWMLEHAPEGQQIDDHDMQEGSGLPDLEFQIGLTWLIQNHFLDRQEDLFH